MAKPKNRRKLIIFSAIGLVLVTLILLAIFKKREPVITVQTEKVARRNLTELVVANGKIQPVVQVTISPEVSGEIIKLPVKEGQQVTNGETLVKINPDIYIAAVNQAKAGYESSLAAKASAVANLEKAQADYDRNLELFHQKLLSESDFIGFKAARNVAKAQLDSADDQVNVAKALADSAQDSLIKTTIVSPLDGTISKLNSQLGERVLGTAQFAGTEILIISDLNKMEARVDVGEMDVVLIAPGQKAQLDVDSFKDRKFTGTVTQIANSSKSSGPTSSSSSSSSSQEATKFEVRIRINETEAFRPGMSVSTEIETRYRTNVLTVPMASVTTRPPKTPEKKDKDKSSKTTAKSGNTNTALSTPSNATNSTLSATGTNSPGTNNPASEKKSKEDKAIEVVFVADGDHVKLVPVKIGICDNDYWEISEGLAEGQEVVSGGYRAISKDLEDGKKIKRGTPDKGDVKEAK
jgi:HlyD family secretion protein